MTQTDIEFMEMLGHQFEKYKFGCSDVNAYILCKKCKFIVIYKDKYSDMALFRLAKKKPYNEVTRICNISPYSEEDTKKAKEMLIEHLSECFPETNFI